jgi:hypothetical protein
LLRVFVLDAKIATRRRACRTMLGNVAPAMRRSTGLTCRALAVRISARGAYRAVLWLILLGTDSAGPNAVHGAAMAAA